MLNLVQRERKEASCQYWLSHNIFRWLPMYVYSSLPSELIKSRINFINKIDKCYKIN